MKILLISNYRNSRQQSMQRFSELMYRNLIEAGHEVQLLRPPTIVGRLCRTETGLCKWIGYIDRFLLFPLFLARRVRWPNVIHICDQANAVYIPYLFNKPHVVTCHDVLAIQAALGEIEESITGWTGRIYQHWILRNLCKAQNVVCVSRQTKRELQRITDIGDNRVTIIPNGLNYPYRPMPADEALSHLQTLDLPDACSFFLHVGGNQWYKNRLGVLRIFAELIKMPSYQTYYLVMAGKPWTFEMKQLAKRLGIEQRAVKKIGVTNEDLRALYSTADALLFPSLREGFGWPIAEAQACGCPVVTSERAPMTEVGGDAAIYIDPTNEFEAAKTIADGLLAREELRAAGLENALRYSTDSMTDSYVQCYSAVIQKRSLS